MSPEPRVCNRALLCISEIVNEEDSEDNMKKDLNFQNMLCLLCFTYALQYFFMVYKFLMMVLCLNAYSQHK
jgi:hypothetical protein